MSIRYVWINLVKSKHARENQKGIDEPLNISSECVRVKDTKQFLIISAKVEASRPRTARELTRATAATASLRPRAIRRIHRVFRRLEITANYSIRLVRAGSHGDLADRPSRRALNFPPR